MTKKFNCQFCSNGAVKLTRPLSYVFATRQQPVRYQAEYYQCTWCDEVYDTIETLEKNLASAKAAINEWWEKEEEVLVAQLIQQGLLPQEKE